jgi:hypothetical protein
MKRTVVTALVVAGLIAAPSGAAAHRHPREAGGRSAAAFSGRCTFSGSVRFKPALTNTMQPVRDFAVATGTCSGTLTDRRGRIRSLRGAAVRYVASDSGSAASCALSAGASGSGRLIFRSGALRFRLSETRAGGAAELSLTGRRGGSASGSATISASANPVSILQACAGSGLRQAPVDIRIQTTPTISG